MSMGIKVKVLRGFALPGQGYYCEGQEITLYLDRPQGVGVLTPERYGALLARGSIKPIKEEVPNGKNFA